MAFRPPNSAVGAPLSIGDPIVGGTNPSVLIVDIGNILGQVMPTVAGTFLRYDGVGFDYASSTAAMVIGNAITGSTPIEVLYTGTLGDLVSDSNFTRDEANNFLTRIYSSAIAGTAYTLIDGATAYESGYNDGSRISSIFLANATKTSAKFTNNLIVSSFEGDGTSATTKYDDGAGITSALILDAGKTDLRWATGAGKNAYVGYDDNTGFLTMRMDSPSDDIENYVRVTPAAVTLRYDNTNPATASGIVSVEDLSSYLTWNDGMGLVGTVTANASGLVSQWTDGSTITGNVSLLATNAEMTWANTNTSQFYGANDTTYNLFQTPFQIYTDEAFTYSAGDVLTSTSGGTGTVVSDDGNGLVILSGATGAFNAGDTVDDGVGNIATLNANGGIYLALHGVGQNITPTATRYAMFLNSINSGQVDDRYEIKHPSLVKITSPSTTLSGKITSYNGMATVSNGIPAERATGDIASSTAAIGATTLYAVPGSNTGMFRISWVASVITAASVSSVLGGTNGFQIIYTDGDDAVVKTSPASVTSSANTTGTQISGSVIVYARQSSNIQYSMDYTSVGGTSMAYNLHFKVEAM